jgi:hypothetical protein
MLRILWTSLALSFTASCSDVDSDRKSRHTAATREVAVESEVSRSQSELNLEARNERVGRTTLGPFVPAPALSIYWLNRPADCRARVTLTSTSENGETALLRVYQTSTVLGASEILQNKFLASLPKPATGQQPRPRTFELSLPAAAGPGAMTEIRLSVGTKLIQAYLIADCVIRDSDYGVSFQNGEFSAWSNLGSRSLFAYVPYHTEIMVLQNKGQGAITVSGVNPSGLRDTASAQLDPIHYRYTNPGTPNNCSRATAPTVGPASVNPGCSSPIVPSEVSWPGTGHSNVLWRFDFAAPTWKFAAGGFPLILSPSAEAVRAIKAGLVFDGKRMLAHGFQRQYLNRLRHQMVYRTGSTAEMRDAFNGMMTDESVSLGTFPNRLLTHPKYSLFADFRSAIEVQNLNRLSDWLGSSDGWQLRDPATTSLASTALKPIDVYASSGPAGVWQMVVAPVANTTNLKFANSVNRVIASIKGAEPLSDPTRWDRLSITAPLNLATPAPDLFHGASMYDNTLSPSLARMALLDGKKASTEFDNPFYAKKELIYRSALAALADLAALPESEVWQAPETDLNGIYAGGTIAFTVGRKVLATYGDVGFFLRKLFCNYSPSVDERSKYACSSLSATVLSEQDWAKWNFSPQEITLWKEIFAVWTVGVQRVAYRLYPNNLVSSRNQSAHYLVGFQQLAQGSGDPFDVELSNEYVDRWVASQDASGFFMESLGPDGSYNGMSNFYAAEFYLNSCKAGACNRKIKDSLVNSYKFFSYTVAPEPRAPELAPQLLGGFNFNHRVGAGFHDEQFEGAKGIALNIPEVNAWTQTYLSALGGTAAVLAPLPSAYLANGSGRMDLNYQRFEAFELWKNSEQLPRANFPAQTSGTSTKHFENQLIAIKRPGYYTAVYVGRPAATQPTSRASMNNEKHRLPWNPNSYNGLDESSGAQIGDPHYWNAAYVGGGMSLFWTPAFGAGILAGSWSPLVHHGLVAIDGASTVRSWEEYTSTSYEPTTSSLETKGSLENKPCFVNSAGRTRCSGIGGYRYERDYTFLDHTVKVSVSVTAESNATQTPGSYMFENIPLPSGKSKEVNERQPKLHYVAPQEVRYYSADSSVGMRIKFKDALRSHPVNNGPKNSKGLQINRLELQIPIPQPGATSTMHYCIQPISANPDECGF